MVLKAYVTEAFTEPTILGGPSYAEVFMRIPDGDANVQVSLSLIRPDGTEWLVTNGLLRLSDRDISGTEGRRIDRTFSAADSKPMPKDRFAPVKVTIPSFAQAFRPGDRLMVSISSPGRNFGAWTFTTIGEPGTPRDVAWGRSNASRLVVGVLPDLALPEANWPCPSLRGQACRPYQETKNTSANG